MGKRSQAHRKFFMRQNEKLSQFQKRVAAEQAAAGRVWPPRSIAEPVATESPPKPKRVRKAAPPKAAAASTAKAPAKPRASRAKVKAAA